MNMNMNMNIKQKKNCIPSSAASISTASTASSRSTILSDLRSIVEDSGSRGGHTSIHERICLNEVEHRLRGISLTGNIRDDAELEEIFDKVYRSATSDEAETDAMLGVRARGRGGCFSEGSIHCQNLSFSIGCINGTHGVDIMNEDDLYESSKSRKMNKLEKLRAARKQLAASSSHESISNRADISSTNHTSARSFQCSSERQKLLAGLGI